MGAGWFLFEKSMIISRRFGESQVKRRVRKQREGTRGGRAREGGLFICEGRGSRQSAQSLAASTLCKCRSSSSSFSSPPSKIPIPRTGYLCCTSKLAGAARTSHHSGDHNKLSRCRPGGCYVWPKLPPPHFVRKVAGMKAAAALPGITG